MALIALTFLNELLFRYFQLAEFSDTRPREDPSHVQARDDAVRVDADRIREYATGPRAGTN
jgi:hypothetical protein